MPKLKTIQSKMGLLIGIMGLFILGNCLYVIHSINSQKQDGALINAAGRQRMLSQRLSKGLFFLNAIGHSDVDLRQKTVSSLKSDITLFESTLSAFKNGGKIQLSKDNIFEIQPLENQQNVQKTWAIWTTFKPALTSYIDNQSRDALFVVADQNMPLLAHSNKIVQELQSVLEFKNAAFKQVQTLIVLATFGLIAFILFNVRTIIVKPIVAISKTLTKVADGNLTVTVKELNRHDEVNTLNDSLAAMIKNLSTIVDETKNAANQVASSSDQLASGNTDLLTRTQEQAGNLEETSSALEEMTSTVAQNSENAQQMNKLAAESSDFAVKGADVITDAVQSMKEINASSKQIADIIEVVDEIAFQTNLLALNAAVEAARAGEQGRGFAVVAVEVRNLAQRTASSAKEIKSLISDSVKKVEKGSELVDRSGNTFQNIIEGIQKVADLSAEVASASKEQTQGINQISGSVAQMDKMTQQNTSLVDELNSAGRNLSHQAQSLQQLMNRFQIAGHVS